jgi:hypothetical protein
VDNFLAWFYLQSRETTDMKGGLSVIDMFLWLKRDGESDEDAYQRVQQSRFVTTFKHDEDAAFYRVDFKLGN